MDEVLSVIISEYNDHAFKRNCYYDEDKTYTGKEVKNLSLWNNCSIAHAISDVQKLYIDNRDRPHTNLFYSCLRLWFAGVATTDVKEIIKHGCWLNLLFFAFSFFFLHSLLRKLFSDSTLILFSLLTAFTNTGSISNTMLIRPYQLQEMLLILFSYEFIRCYEFIDMGKNLWEKKNFFRLVAATGFTFLSGYFAAIYILLLYGILAFSCWKKNQKENLKFLGISFLLSILFARLLFGGFFCGFSCGRAGEAFGQFNDAVILKNFLDSTRAFFDILQNHLFYISVLWITFFMAAVFGITQRKEQISQKCAVLIPACCLLWSFICMFLAPFKELRYIVPCFPLLALVIPFIISNFQKNARTIFVLVVSITYIIVATAAGSAKVENLFVGQSKMFEMFTKKVEVPVFILSKTVWKYSAILHQMADSQRYEFPRSKESLEKKLQNRNHAIILFSDDYSSREIQEIIPKNFRPSKDFPTEKACYFTVYELYENKPK